MSETGLRIRFYGDPVLRERARPVEKITEQTRAIVKEMDQLMRISGGIGLAAPQVGLLQQMLVVDVGQGPVVLINPRIVKKTGSEVLEEGCLSLPGVYVKVRRAKSVVISARNQNDEKISLSAADILARALQHEIDHLRGKMIIDYAGWIKRIALRKKLKRLLAERESRGGLS